MRFLLYAARTTRISFTTVDAIISMNEISCLFIALMVRPASIHFQTRSSSLLQLSLHASA